MTKQSFTLDQQAESERIAKSIARAGICSRREAEARILDGRVTVNGEVISSPALNVGARDKITIDAECGEMNLHVSASELKKRKTAWKAPKARYTRGVLAKYAKQVSSASSGAVTD